MSFPKGLAEDFNRAKEYEEANTPYDKSIATKVVFQPTPKENQTVSIWEQNPWDLFDRKVVLAYTGNKNRIELLQREFSRVGLTGVEVLWNFNDAYLPKLRNVVLCNRLNNWKLSIFNNTMGHYRIIKTAYELGSERCLVMEDDIRFLRDVNLVKPLLEKYPQDCDIGVLDSVIVHPQEKESVKFVPWNELEYPDFSKSAACYALNRKAMLRFIEIYENPITNLGVLPHSDSFFNYNRLKGLKIYYSHPNIARQVSVSDTTNTDYFGWSCSYDKVNANRKNYGK